MDGQGLSSLVFSAACGNWLRDRPLLSGLSKAPWERRLLLGTPPPPAPTRTSRASVSVGLVLHQPHGQQEPGSRAEVAGEEGSLTQSGRRGSHEC